MGGHANSESRQKLGSESSYKGTKESTKLFVDGYIDLHFIATALGRAVCFLDSYDDRPYRISEKRPCIAVEAIVFGFDAVVESFPAKVS